MNVGARFSPLRTILFVSEVALRHRKADFAFKSAVSIEFMGAPSIACDSMRLPPQSRIAIATIWLFFVAHAAHESTRARAPALEMTLTSLVNCSCTAPALEAIESITETVSNTMHRRMRISFSPKDLWEPGRRYSDHLAACHRGESPPGTGLQSFRPSADESVPLFSCPVSEFWVPSPDEADPVESPALSPIPQADFWHRQR